MNNKWDRRAPPVPPPIVEAEIVPDAQPGPAFYPALVRTLEAAEEQFSQLWQAVRSIQNVLELSQSVFLAKHEATDFLEKLDQAFAGIQKLSDDVCSVAAALAELDKRLERLEAHSAKVTAVVRLLQKQHAIAHPKPPESTNR